MIDNPGSGLVDDDPRGLNTGAAFEPQHEEGSRPSVTVAGVQVCTYVDHEGCLTVSVLRQDSEIHYGPDPKAATIPLRVLVDGQQVMGRALPDIGCWCTYLTDATETVLVRRDPDCLVHDEP